MHKPLVLHLRVISYFDREDRNTIIAGLDPVRSRAGYRLQIPGDELKGFEVDLYLNPLESLKIVLGAAKFTPTNLSGGKTRNIPDDQFGALARYTFSGDLKGLAGVPRYITFRVSYEL